VRAIGASNHGAARLTEALRVSQDGDWPRYECLQPLYNLYERSGFEDALRDTCIQHGVGVICLTSLAKGFLTGKYRTEAQSFNSVWAERLRRYQNPRGELILAALDRVAAELGATPGQVALAWLIAQPGVTAPIVAADDLEQLAEIMGAARLVLLPAHRDRLNAASAP
jgi:aryl-alcohol dehydrogenase-like predicted oxidoreductase